jgi:hypothetical protein
LDSSFGAYKEFGLECGGGGAARSQEWRAGLGLMFIPVSRLAEIIAPPSMRGKHARIQNSEFRIQDLGFRKGGSYLF